jgi:hypothetical protein
MDEIMLKRQDLIFTTHFPNLLLASGSDKSKRHMSKISHTKPSQHSTITHWTHTEEMKWFISAVLVVLTANNLGFGLALAEICQTFGQRQ